MIEIAVMLLALCVGFLSLLVALWQKEHRKEHQHLYDILGKTKN